MHNTNYQKINTLFKRDEKKVIIPSQFTCEEFYELKDLKWECTEKIDGTNIHVDIEYSTERGLWFSFQGRTDNAVIPSHLLKKLHEIFTEDVIMSAFNQQFASVGEDETLRMSIYGEGYGMKIQKGGGNYIPNDVGFILFDVKVGQWWLGRENLEDIASKLNVPIVPLIGYMTLQEAIEFVSKGFNSIVSQTKNHKAEGLVLKTRNGLLFRNGQRIITKIKTCDFVDLRNK
jgi:hypothetical protein